MNKRLLVVLVFLISNGIALVASEANQSDSEKATSAARCLKILYKPVSHFGIDIDEQDHHGITYLMHAVIQGRDAAITWSLKNKACVNRVNNAGATAITLAAQHVSDDNYASKERKLLQLLRSCPFFDGVMDPEHEKSPKDVLKSLRDCYPPDGMRASADLLESCIAHETERRVARALQCGIQLKKRSLVGLVASSKTF